MFKIRSILLVSVAGLAAFAAADRPLRLSGTTSGSFDLDPVRGGRGASPDALRFVGGAFDVTSAFDPVGGAWRYALGAGSLGTFSLMNLGGSYSGAFVLTVSLMATDPGAAAKGTPFQATFTGLMTSTAQSIRFDFDGPQTFALAGPGGGSFTMGIEDLTLVRLRPKPESPKSQRSSATLFGGGVASVSSVPGPGALGAYGLGIAAKGLRRRRRRASA